MSKKKLIIPLLIFAAALLVAYARFIEPHWLRIKKTEIKIARAPESRLDIRIAHLTDLHLSPDVSLDYLRSVFGKAVEQRPDLICLTGDYITSIIEHKAEYAEAFKILSSAAPTFACPGNHDGGAWAKRHHGYPDVEEIKSTLADGGVVFLENETAELSIRGRKILIGGMGDIWAERCFPEKIQAMLDTAKSDLRIILTHNPDSKVKAKNLKWDLLLAGHTHGGQLYLPFIGAPFAPITDRRYLNGLYEYADGKIYVSPGVGSIHGLRLNCRPEISILEIRK